MATYFWISRRESRVLDGTLSPESGGAIQKQAAELIHMSGTDFYYESLPLLANGWEKTMPGSEEKKVFLHKFGHRSGEGAMKLARYATKRDKRLRFTAGFMDGRWVRCR